MAETKPTTEVNQVVTDVDLDSLLGTPGADSIMVPGEGPDDKGEAAPAAKPSFFNKGDVDLDFLDDDPTEPTAEDLAAQAAADENLSEEEKAAKAAEAAAALEKEDKTGKIDSIIDELNDDDPDKGGRPKLDKTGMAQLVETLIKDEIILPFEDDEKKLEDYTMDDYKELIQLNFQNKEQQIKQETPKEFFESLPTELQYAAEYVANGGQDLKGLFRALAASEETKALSIDTEQGQEQAAKQFLQASNFGTDEEIQEQIDSWKDLDKLEDKAKQFKPKLDAMQEQVVQRRVKEQEAMKAKREESAQKYADSIFETLDKGELNGIKMNSKVQNMIYSGLIQPNYKSASGQPTNMLGHLLEKHQYIEPNHGLIAEALWLLADPDGYRSEITKTASNSVAAETARKLKLEQADKNSGGSDAPLGRAEKKSKGLQRQPKGFFKR